GERGIEVLHAVRGELLGLGRGEVPRGDDHVGVDVVAVDEGAPLEDDGAHAAPAPEPYDAPTPVTPSASGGAPRTSSGWARRPMMAFAAATAGFARYTFASRWPIRPT